MKIIKKLNLNIHTKVVSKNKLNYNYNFYDFLKNNNYKYFFKYKIKYNLESIYRIRKNNKLNIILNIIFKKGKKLSVLKNMNKFNTDFYIFIQKNKTNFLCNLILEKLFLFKFEYLITLLFSNSEIMFNIKKKNASKNLKKLKRKPIKNQIIYLKKEKRLPFLIKLLNLNIKKGKSKYFYFNFLNFVIDNFLFFNNSEIYKKKKQIHFKILKYFKKN